VEHAPAAQRGRFGSYPQLGAPLGLLLANGALAAVTALTTDDQFLAWGWRIPFLLSVVLVAAGFVIRRKVEESPVYQELKQTGSRSRVPIAVLFKNHWPLVVAGALLFAANNAVGYMTTGGYVQSYSVNHLGMDPCRAAGRRRGRRVLRTAAGHGVHPVAQRRDGGPRGQRPGSRR
jgi:MFS family permease